MTILLRVEAVFVAALALAGYALFGQSWWLFLILLLVPDISMLGYLAGPRIGAISYNSVHSYPGPILLLASGGWSDSKLALSIGLIWTCHIAIDRALGYGLKYFSAFQDTHLGRIGKSSG